MRSFQHVSIVTVGYFSVPDFPVVNDCFPFSWSGTLSSLIGNGLETHSCPRNSQRTTGQLFACCCSLPLKIYRPLLQRIKFAINLPRRSEEGTRRGKKLISRCAKAFAVPSSGTARVSLCCIRWRLI